MTLSPYIGIMYSFKNNLFTLGRDIGGFANRVLKEN